MSNPQKILQVTTGPIVNTSAPLPVLENADGRAINMNGTAGSFITGGPFGHSSGSAAYVNAAGTLRPDQIIDAFLLITGAGNFNITTPSAKEFVQYLGLQAPYGASLWPNTNNLVPTPYYPTFEFTITTGAGVVSTITGGTGVTFLTTGTLASNADSGALVASTTYRWRVVISNCTPGAEAVRILKF